MELETLFTEQKWNILKSLSEGKFSPLQLANRSNTTIANISQQLRLLEAAELVKKEKIKNIRTILSLVYICYIFVESGAFYELREDLDFIIMLITAFYWGYSVMWMKAHDTK